MAEQAGVEQGGRETQSNGGQPGGGQSEAPGHEESPHTEQGEARGSEDPELDEALARGRGNARREQEDNDAQHKAREGNDRHEPEKGRSFLDNLLRFAKWIFVTPFAIVMNAARRIVGKVTGEDLVSKVKQSKQDLEDLEKAHDRADGKFSERVQDIQRDISEAHLEQSRMMDDLESLAHRNRASSPNGPPESPAAKSTEEPAVEVSGTVIGGLGGPAPGASPSRDGQEVPGEAWSAARGLDPSSNDERSGAMPFADSMKTLMSHVSAAATSHDILSRESWKAWGESGATAKEVGEAIHEARGPSWQKAIDRCAKEGYGNLDDSGKEAYLATILEMFCADNSGSLLRDAKGSDEVFDRQALTQLSLAGRVMGAIVSPKSGSGMEAGGFDEVAECMDALPDGVELRAFEAVCASYEDLREPYCEWASQADKDIAIEVTPATPSGREARPVDVVEIPGGAVSDTARESAENTNGELKGLDAPDSPGAEVIEDDALDAPDTPDSAKKSPDTEGFDNEQPPEPGSSFGM